jgi:hypothetical protein
MKDHSEFTDSDTEPLDRLDGVIRAALERTGAALPTTVEGVALLEKYLRENQVSLPPHLQDANFVLERIKADYAPKSGQNLIGFVSPYQDAIRDDLARAARNGGDVSAEVEEQMRQDRERAERQATPQHKKSS